MYDCHKLLISGICLIYRVLVHAGVSGVGVVAVQLVRAWGGSVTTTVSSRAAPLAQMLGAEDIITYDNTNFDKELMLREKFVHI